MKPRQKRYGVARDVVAGCYDCFGDDYHWHGPNAQGVAARHSYATGHSTWAEVHLSVRYGPSILDRPDLFQDVLDQKWRKGQE